MTTTNSLSNIKSSPCALTNVDIIVRPLAGHWSRYLRQIMVQIYTEYALGLGCLIQMSLDGTPMASKLICVRRE